MDVGFGYEKIQIEPAAALFTPEHPPCNFKDMFRVF